ncbi:MAG: PBP1A family penicillin-binding protein [Actinobacteria bacterium]|nr:PBP1A family penicillin-binding protein [Actinomycetota bacterium]
MSFIDRLRQIRHTPLDISIAAAIVLIGLPVVLAGAVGLGAYLYFFKLSPPVAIPEPEGLTEARSSHIYASDGTLMATLRGANYRVPVDYDQMPDHLVRATVASEDERFFEHSGLDLAAIIRALTESRGDDEQLRGASTITQQYVSSVFVGKERSLARKIKEAQMATQLEREVGKEKILERYLNTVYFGAGAYGAEAAANTYFDKPASELTVSESAMLVGLIPAPSRYSPYASTEQAERRRQLVIDRMESANFLTSAQAAEARRDRPELEEITVTEEVFRYPYAVDAVKKYLQSRYGVDRAFNGGLEVTTTIDPRLQDQAEKVVTEALPTPDDPSSSIVSIEPSTGYVRALVGGRNFEDEKFNLAIQGRRQPGSAFKPFVLTSALESGLLPSTRFNGPSTLCVPGWRPECQVSNYGRSGFGTITVEQATVNSVNTVYAQMIMRVGPSEVVETVRRMGIPGPTWMPPRSGCAVTEEDLCRTEIEPLPALALGSEEVTPLEMASAYGTLANRGVYQEPALVSRITDASGDVIESGPKKPERALEENIADNVTSILQGVVTSGTGTRANIGRPVAGKTGTAQNFQNAWFVGYTPELSTAVWVGYTESNRELSNIQGFSQVTGGSIPASIWKTFTEEALKDVPISEFPEASPMGALALPFKADSSAGSSPDPSPSPETSPTATAPAASPPPMEPMEPSEPDESDDSQPPGLLDRLFGFRSSDTESSPSPAGSPSPLPSPPG